MSDFHHGLLGWLSAIPGAWAAPVTQDSFKWVKFGFEGSAETNMYDHAHGASNVQATHNMWTAKAQVALQGKACLVGASANPILQIAVQLPKEGKVHRLQNGVDSWHSVSQEKICEVRLPRVQDRMQFVSRI